MPLPLRHVTAAGIRFAYFEEGTGPLVLLFHGFPDTASTWDHVRPLIAAKGYRVVTPYLRGYAPSAIPDHDTDMKTLGGDPLALIDALGESKAILVGHDWGAGAVYAAAALGPEKITKLFAVAIPHPASLVPTPRTAWGARHFVAYKFPGAAGRFARNDFAALRAIYKRWSPDWTPDESELAGVRQAFAERASLDAAFGYYRALTFVAPRFMRRKIEVDTVAFAGQGDPLITPDDYRAAGRWFAKKYEVEEVPGGHFLHREHPAAFAEKLLKHL